MSNRGVTDDIEFLAAFDVVETKVGKDLSKDIIHTTKLLPIRNTCASFNPLPSVYDITDDLDKSMNLFYNQNRILVR
jgi:myo-inositol-1-phosphate synthase